MDIKELESFRLSDAIKFHDKLNPALWTEKGELDPEVKQQLMVIAKDFMAELGLPSLKVDDITISGSNAAYTYTPYSDLDLHILVDFNKLPDNEVYQELFKAKKTLYNDTHDITVRGVPVELYVQDTNQPVVSLGEYSLLKDEWIKIPKKRKSSLDQTEARLKYEKLGSMIELALKTSNLQKIEKVLDIIKRYRKAGLDSKGEFGPENLAFKALRKQGYIKKLYDLKNDLHSKELSIENVTEILDKEGMAEGGAETSWSHGTEKITLQDVLELTKHIKQINLPINDNLKSKLIHWDGNPEEIERINQVTVSNQFPILVMLDGQGQIDWILDGNHRLHKAIRSKAKTIPAKLIKPTDLSDKAKRIFHIKEASGYIPSEKEKNDPRFKTALTVDVKPDSIKKNAKAFGSKVSRAGIPPILKFNGKISK